MRLRVRRKLHVHKMGQPASQKRRKRQDAFFFLSATCMHLNIYFSWHIIMYDFMSIALRCILPKYRSSYGSQYTCMLASNGVLGPG
jgi:hypothetical protein